MTNLQSLNEKQQAIVTIATFTAKGDIDKLKISLTNALDAGLTINEIKEILIQMYAYTGFPRSLNGLGALMSVLETRQSEGIEDETGVEANPLPEHKSKLELGSDIQTILIGAPASGPALSFAPTIDIFLKEHLFADIFGRDILDFQSREIATIAALASLGNVSSQLRSHIKIGLNIGLTKEQLAQLITILAEKVSKTEADIAAEVLASI